MGHEILEAIIENGQIKSSSKPLPQKRIKVHIIYDIDKERQNDYQQIIKEAAGIYKNIDPNREAGRLRDDWERNVNN